MPHQRRALILAVAAVALVSMWVLLVSGARAYEIGPAPTVAPPPVQLSLAQGRWFIQHEVHRWGTARPHDWQCWRLSPATVACSFYSRLGIDAYWLRRSKVLHLTLLAERQCCEYVRLWSAGERPLSGKEKEALGVRG